MPLFPVFNRHCPAPAVEYCYQLWLSYSFHLKITKARKGKLGDYRFSAKGVNPHQITVNENLNPFSFLITYIHEVAHLQTFQQYKRKVNPHSKEWKRNFQKLMLPLLTENVFPEPILIPLQQYMADPKASSCSDATLMRALQQQELLAHQTFLIDLNIGELFSFHNRIFEKGIPKRTRILCKEKKTGKQYLIPGQALVEKIIEPVTSKS